MPKFIVKDTPLSKITPYARNPRKNEKAVDVVAASLKEFKFRQPIVVDTEGVIVVGHTRYYAAQDLGITSVPVHIADDLTPEQIKAYRIMDNKAHEMAEWDNDLLALEFKDLELVDFDMSLTGFRDNEIENIMGDLGDKEGNADDDDVPAPEKTAVTKAGDIWVLGNHRLMCGDTTSLMDMHRLMDGEEADLIWTDPPYNVAYESADGKSIENDDMSDEAFSVFLNESFNRLFEIAKEGCVIYIAHADSYGLAFRSAMIDAGFMMKQCIIWVKNAAALGRQDYNWRHEPILFGWKAGAAHYFCQDFTQNTVTEESTDYANMKKEKLVKILEDQLARQDSVHYENKPKKSTEHPTMKPVDLVARHIKNSSRQGEIVVDGFGGSGTTLIACEKTDRKARIMEFDPIYADVIIRRYEEWSGKPAYHEDGREFKQVKRGR